MQSISNENKMLAIPESDFKLLLVLGDFIYQCLHFHLNGEQSISIDVKCYKYVAIMTWLKIKSISPFLFFRGGIEAMDHHVT